MTLKYRSLLLALFTAIIFASPLTAQLEWQAWLNTPGDSVHDWVNSPKLEQEATRWNQLTRFESAHNFADDFLVRIRGTLVAPETGSYHFHLATEGAALLRLSPSEDVSEAIDIVDSNNGSADSAQVELIAGERYYLEALHKGGKGADSLRVGWTLPSQKRVDAIAGELFTPISDPESILDFNFRKVLLEPYTRVYNRSKHLARNRHDPKPNEHLTRETVFAASVMLETNDPELHQEAIRALEKILPYQDSFEGSASFGNWPRVIERPGNFNAQNIGGFIGGELIVILQRNRDKLPPELVKKLELALRRAAIRGMKYNPPVTATNIITKAVAVALIADQMLDIPEVRHWAHLKLEQLHEHTLREGLPTEYNSPTYSSVVVKALAMLLAYYQDEAVLNKVNDLYAASWREIALNYNPNLELWTGPTARRYWDVHNAGPMLQAATDNSLFLGQHSYEQIPQPMPEQFRQAFQPLSIPVEHRAVVLSSKAEANIIDQQSPVPQTVTLYHTPTFSIGSFNRSDLWSQRRHLIAYWGNQENQSIFRISSPSGVNGLLAAQLYSIQERGYVLTALNFCTDAGWGVNPYDLHGAKRDVPHEVSDLRIRFSIAASQNKKPFTLPDSLHANIAYEKDGVPLEIKVLHAQFGDSKPYWELTPEGDLDLVLHSGEKVILNDLEHAAAAFSIKMGHDEETQYIKSEGIYEIHTSPVEVVKEQIQASVQPKAAVEKVAPSEPKQRPLSWWQRFIAWLKALLGFESSTSQDATTAEKPVSMEAKPDEAAPILTPQATQAQEKPLLSAASTAVPPAPKAAIWVGDGKLRVELGTQSITVPVKPASYGELQDQLKFEK